MLKYISLFTLLLATVSMGACGVDKSVIDSDNKAVAETAIETATEADVKTALITQLNEIETVMLGDNLDKIVGTLVPPAMLRATGLGLGLSESELPKFEAQVMALTRSTLRTVKFSNINIDYPAINYTKSTAGALLAYIPVQHKMLIGETHYQSTGDYVAIHRDGEWIVLTPSDAKAVENLKRIFVELQDQVLLPMKIEET